MFNIKLPHANKSVFVIGYKLLHDALFLFLLAFISMLVAEGALPGIISSHISLTKVSLAIFLIIGATIFIGKNLHITYQNPPVKKNKLLPVLILLAFLLVGNSLLRFALWENVVITLIVLFLFLLFYQMFFENEK